MKQVTPDWLRDIGKGKISYLLAYKCVLLSEEPPALNGLSATERQFIAKILFHGELFSDSHLMHHKATHLRPPFLSAEHISDKRAHPPHF